MKKDRTKGYLILGIMFVLISIAAFTIPVLRTVAFWIAYVFMTFAFAVQIVIWKVAFGKEETIKSKFLSFPVVHIGLVYLAVQIAAFAVFMFVPNLSTWSAIVICSFIAGISAVCMITADVGRSEIERIEVKVQKKVFYIKELQVDIEMLADSLDDSEIKTALKQLVEIIRFSDPMSSEQLADLENKISTKVVELKIAENKSEIITELGLLLKERNEKCKIFK